MGPRVISGVAEEQLFRFLTEAQAPETFSRIGQRRDGRRPGAHDPARCVGDQVWKPVSSAIRPHVANGPASLWWPLMVQGDREGAAPDLVLPKQRVAGSTPVSRSTAASLMKRPGHRRSRQGAGVVRPLLSEQADGAAARRPPTTPRRPPERAYHPYHPRDRYQRYRLVRVAIGSGPGRELTKRHPPLPPRGGSWPRSRPRIPRAARSTRWAGAG